MQSLLPAESRDSFSAPAGVSKTHQRRSLSHGRGIGFAHATFASHEGQICKPKMSQFDAIQGDTACAGMFSRTGKMRRPRFIRSISRYRVAEAGKPAVSKCKCRTFKMRRTSFGRTGQSSRRWLGKNWRRLPPHRARRALVESDPAGGAFIKASIGLAMLGKRLHGL